MTWTEFGIPVMAINILGIGQELMWFGISAVIALAFSTQKREYLIGWTFVYTIFFLIGLAHLVWLDVILALAAGIYWTRTRDNT